MRSVNPATGELLEEFDWLSDQDLDRLIGRSFEAFKTWRDAPLSERSTCMKEVARILRERVEVLAETITREMGKPIGEAEAEIEKCAFGCDYFAQNAERFLADEVIPADSPNSVVVYEPIGIVLAIMPWNFPFWQVVRQAAPALMAGNVLLVKHAPNVPRCALALERCFRDAGFPEGVYATAMVDVPQVERIIADPRVAGVTLTGSERAGSQVAALAGKHIKKSVMELGGSDPFILLEDANVEEAVATALKARFQNSGQSCIAAKRFIVHEAVAEEFEARFTEEVRKLRVGDPLDRSTQIGPIARDDLRDNLKRQVEESVAQGARVLVGGEAAVGRGSFYPATVLTDVTRDMPAWREETFGPVAVIVRVGNLDEAVEAANDSVYGLGASVWTEDDEAGKRVALRLAAGGVFINGMTHSDPRLPFGGVKRSGYGRELAEAGIREFVNIKTIWRP